MHAVLKPRLWISSPLAMAMARRSWNRSPVDLYKPAIPVAIDCSDASYAQDVLLLENGQTETALDKALETQAEQSGISIFDLQAKLESLQVQESSTSDTSTAVVEPHHVRSDSAGSQGTTCSSTFTGVTSSRPLTDQVDHSPSTNPRKRPGTLRRLSFSEYEKYLLMAEEQAVVDAGFTPALRDRTLSLFSVSSRRKYFGLRRGIKQRFRLRSKTTGDEIAHITCRCKAQFCYICGAVWDPVVGCPNYCPGEEELERRRRQEAARIAEQEAEKVAREERERLEALEEAAAAKRTQNNEELNTLRTHQISERDRFFAYERKIKWLLWTRHGQDKLDLLARYGDLHSKMKERHLKTAAHLEDRQVYAEMELRAALKQRERSIRIRLKHMEAYCEGLGRGEIDGNPARVVTDRDLQELRQQYNIRDDLERFHQAKINVMRDKQAKQMEHLLERQAEELHKLGVRLAEEVETLEEGVGVEEERLSRITEERRRRLMLRWAVQAEIELKRLQKTTGLRFGPVSPIHIPPSGDSAGFSAVSELIE
ncbi:hypothetical protein B7463_g1470, partial [Scytalidium lignicola]